MTVQIRDYLAQFVIWLAFALLAAVPLHAAQTLRQEKAEFFRLFDLENPSLLSHNTGLQTVRAKVTNAAMLPSDDDALAVYSSAMSNLLDNIPASNYSCSPSRVLEDPDTFVTNFFSWIDLDYPGLETVKAYVAATNYPAALDAWRDYTVNKFRQMDGSQLTQQSYKGHVRQQNIAQLLLGEKSFDQYLFDGTNSYGGVDFYEIFGMSGEPGTIGPISWTNQPPTSETTYDSKYVYHYFTFASSLLYRYWRGTLIATGDDLTLASSGTLITAQCSAPHGLETGDYITVYNVTQAAYNGVFKITVVDATTLMYNALAVPDTSPAAGWSRSIARSRAVAPLQKWFEILGDYATRQKNMASSLQLVENTALRSEYRLVYDRSDWGVHAGAVLAQGDRLRELLAAVAIFTKMLPEDVPRQRDWNTAIQDAVTEPVSQEALQLIPAESLARIILSLTADTTEAVMLAYLRVGWMPNQRLNGLNSLYLAALFFDEFKAAPELLRQADAALADYANKTFYAGGPMLERSPNYNESDAARIRTLLTMTGDSVTPGVSLLADSVMMYERAIAYMQAPVGSMPRMASFGGWNVPPLWEGESEVSAWRTRFLNGVDHNSETTATNLYLGMLDSGLPVPSVTSVAFPYAGYYLMRNGWESQAHYLYFANSPSGNGHHQMDDNGIQVCAFGRSLLSTGGPPPYGPTLIDPSLIDDYEGLSDYQGEGSSFKVNTVVVDGRSQNEGGIKNPTVTTNTMPNIWFTSPEFDFVEGVYAEGYGRSDSGYWFSLIYDAFTNASVVVNSVTHTRSVMFLRNPGLWIVTDLMTANDSLTHDYRQIWNFPAYSESYGPSYGFLPGEVITDNAQQRISTVDADGPNIHLYHLGPQPVTYETYIGSRTPYLGWTSYGISGLRLPAANIHALWKGSGTQMVVTVIAPSDTGASSPVSSIHTNSSSATAIDLELALDNGHTLRIVQGVNPQTCFVGNRNVSAKTIISDIAPDGLQCGLALTAPEFSQTNFSFTASSTNFTPVAVITRPTNFNWTVDGDWLVPSTASPHNTPPEIADVPDQRVAVNLSSAPISFMVRDNESQATNLIVSVHSSNQTLLSDANIILSGEGTNRTLSITPEPDQFGNTTISLTVTDPQGLSSITSFTLGVYASLYWDLSTDSGLQAGSGGWDGSVTNWSLSAEGAAPRFAWINSGNSAVFAGADGDYTVSVSGVQTVNNLLFSSAGYTITGGAFEHAWDAMTICTDADAVINTPIHAHSDLIKTGDARLTLGAVNSYPGDTALTAGTLEITTDNALSPTGGLAVTSMGGAGTLVLSDVDQTVKWLTVAGAVNTVTNQMAIDENKVLAVTGFLGIGGIDPDIMTLAEVTGGGTLAVINEGASVQIGMVTNASYENRNTLDMNGLGTFIADLGANGTLRVGENINNLGSKQATLVLAATNVITTGTLGVGQGGRGVQQTLKLGRGQTIINADTFNFGTGVRDSASIAFLASTGTLSIRDSSGTGRAKLNLGTGGTTTGSTANNLLDLRGHFVDALFDTIIVGEQIRAGTATHKIYFDTGVIDATGIIMAQTKGSGSSTSTISIGGAIMNIGTNGILLAGDAIGNLELTGGTVSVDGDILKTEGGTGSAAITLNGTDAVLDLKGHVIGSATARVDTFLNYGTLRNLGEFNGGADFEKNTGGTLVIDGVNHFSGRTLISFGTLRLAHAEALPDNSEIVIAGGVLDLGGLTLTNDVVRISSGAIDNGALVAGSIVKTGEGIAFLKGTLHSENPILIEAGTLQLNILEPGLYEGAVSGRFNITTPNPQTSVARSTFYANTRIGWPSETTYIYSGYLWNRALTNVIWTFAENFDDSVWLKIDGNTVLNNGVWNVPTLSSYTLSPGAHAFEARFGQGGGGAGPNIAGWWTALSIGFGYDPSGRNEEAFANFQPLTDPGGGSLLTTGTDSANTLTNLIDSASSVVINSGAVLDLGGFRQTLEGVSGAGSIINGTLVVTGTLAPGGANVIGDLTLHTDTSLTGTLLIDIGTNGSSDCLIVNGGLDLSSATLSIANQEQLEINQQYTIITCNGLLTTTFAVVDVENSNWKIIYKADGTVRLVYRSGAVLLVK